MLGDFIPLCLGKWEFGVGKCKFTLCVFLSECLLFIFTFYLFFIFYMGHFIVTVYIIQSLLHYDT